MSHGSSYRKQSVVTVVHLIKGFHFNQCKCFLLKFEPAKVNSKPKLKPNIEQIKDDAYHFIKYGLDVSGCFKKHEYCLYFV